MPTLVALEDKTLEEDVDTRITEGTGQTFQDLTRMTGDGDPEVTAHPDQGEGDRGVMVLPDPTIDIFGKVYLGVGLRSFGCLNHEKWHQHLNFYPCFFQN